jgi:muramoyltetrapeptide carboxypeptidase
MSDGLARPRALRYGDGVAVVAPASPFDATDFDAGVAELAALGFAPQWHHDLFARSRYVAGEPAVRAADFLRWWANPQIAGLFGARGGYGSAQIVSSLDPGTIRRTPKAFVGYSDLTTLLTWLVCHCGIVAFHGPTVTGRLGRGHEAYDKASLLSALTRAEPMGEMSLGQAEVFRAGEARGRLLGGTLTQLAAACGTPYALAPWDDTVLLLEDVGERPYRVDRLVQQLRDAGVFRRVRGVVLGTFPRCDEPSGAPTVREVLADLLADFPGPVIFGLPTGHVDGPALTLPLGVQTQLVASGEPRLVIEEHAVREDGL